MADFFRAWVGKHVDSPLRERILAHQDNLQLRIGRRDELAGGPPPLDLLAMFGARPEQLIKLENSTHVCLVSDFGPDDRGFWSALAACHALMDKAVDALCFDPVRLSLRDPAPVNGWLKIAEHIIVPFSVQDDGLGWMTTKGMSKFGLPELEFTSVPPALANDLIDVLNGLAGYLVRRSRGNGLVLELPKVLDFAVRELLESLREPGSGVEGSELDGFRTRLGLTYHPPQAEDMPAFLTFGPPPDFDHSHENWYYQILEDLWGRKETLVNVEGDLLMQAHKRAVEELPVLKQRFQAGLLPGEIAMIKCGFPYGEGEEQEFMWVTLESWTGDRLVGLLSNHPVHRTDLEAGQRLEVPEDQVFDWTLHDAGGSWLGGYTDSIVREWMPD